MGEQFKRDHAKRFKHQADLAFQREFETATLFSRQPDVLTRAYNCEGAKPVSSLAGEPVALYPVGDGVCVVHGSRVIGTVVAEEARGLADAIRSDPACRGLALGVVDEASHIGGDFAIRISGETDCE